MNRLSEYITGMTLTRQLLMDARVKSDDGKDRLAMRSLIAAFDAFVKATNNAVSIREKAKPKSGVRR